LRRQNYNYIMKYIPIRWNSFHYIKCPEEELTLGIRCEVYTRRLTIPQLSPNTVRRLKLLEQLFAQGMTDKQISDLFNNIGLTTPHGKTYTYKNVWVTRKKWALRQVRERDTYLIIYPPKFYRRYRIRRDK
jgi:hypothetical protein